MVDNRSISKVEVEREQAEPIAQNGLRFKIRNTPRYNTVLWSQRKDKRAHGGREGGERRREEDAHDGMRAFRLCLCASTKWSVYTRFPPLLPLLLRCSTASRIVGHAAKSLGSAILYQRGRAQIDCQPYRLSFFVSPESFANTVAFLIISTRIRSEFCRIFLVIDRFYDI